MLKKGKQTRNKNLKRTNQQTGYIKMTFERGHFIRAYTFNIFCVYKDCRFDEKK